MSITRARNALHGRPTDCIPLFDIPSHPGFLRKLTGLDPLAHPEETVSAAVRKLDVDLLMGCIPNRLARPLIWRHKGSHRTDIFNYDPARDRADLAALPLQEAIAFCQAQFQRDQELVGDVAMPMAYTFTTCIHYAAEDLDWEEFLMACITEEQKLAILLDRFEAASRKIMEAWMHTPAEVIMTHDDIAMTTGTVQSGAWLRRHLMPRYRRIFEPIRAHKVPQLYMTDGDFTSVIPDLLDLGVDGFFLDVPCISLEKLAAQCGPDKVYFTGPTPATLQMGSPAGIREEMRRLAETARHLPRFFFHFPGGQRPDMPTENIQAYYEAVREYGRR